MFFDFPNHQKSSFRDVLGASLRSLGVSGAASARLGCIWDVLWVRLGVSQGVLEASWRRLGGVLEASWRRLER